MLLPRWLSVALASLPALVLILAWVWWRRPGERSRIVVQAGLAAAVALLIAGWWYGRARSLTGGWSGQPWEAALRDLPLRSLLRRALDVNWYNAIDSTLVSHLWFGNWSFLQVRSWMYHFFEYIVVVGTAGLLALGWRLWKNQQTRQAPAPAPLLVLAAFYGFFWAGLAYQVVVMFVSHGVSATTGWFMYCLVAAEVILATAGLSEVLPARWRPWILPAGTACFAALELYGTHFLLIPYYTGLIAHRPNGLLASFHLGQLGEVGLGTVLAGLPANKPAFVNAPLLILGWFFFLAATVGLVAISLRSRQRRSG